MSEFIRNITSKVSNIETPVILGEKDYKLIVKRCVIKNTSNSNAKVTLYTKDKNNNINYIVTKILILPKTSQDLLLDSFPIEEDTTLYAINNYAQELDLICHYISEKVAIKIKSVNPTEPPIEPKAKIKVIISPSSVLSYKPKWRINYGIISSEWLDGGITYEVDADTYEIEFKELDNWRRPSKYSYYFEKDKTTTIEGVYYRDKIQELSISFTIPKEYEKYLYWCVVRDDMTTQKVIIDWCNEIEHTEDLAVGNYIIKIQQIEKINKSNEYIFDYETNQLILDNIFVKEQQHTFKIEDSKKTLNYDFTNGSYDISKICVTIFPEKLRSYVNWYLISEDALNKKPTLFNSGETINIPYGTYYLSSTVLPGWHIKNNLQITASKDNNLILHDREYYEYSSLRIKFNNNKTLARWRLVNTEIWYSDNEEVLLYPDSYEVEFNEIINYVKPENQYFNLEAGNVNVSTVTYEEYGSLKIKINSITKPLYGTDDLGPPQWRVVSYSVWKNSDEVVYLKAGEYEIEFNTVENVFCHNNITVQINAGELTEETIEYSGVYLLSTPTKSSLVFHKLNSFTILENLFGSSIIPSEISCVKFSHDGLLLAIGHNTLPYLTIFNCVDFQSFENYDIVAPLSGVRSIAFSNDNKYMVVSHNDYPYLTVYECLNWNQITITDLPASYCNSITFSHNDNYLVLGYDQSPFLKAYAVTLAFEPITLDINISNEILCCEFSEDDSILSIGTHEGECIYLIDTNTWSQINTTFSGIKETIYSIVFKDGYIIACSNYYLYLYHYDKDTYEKIDLGLDLPMGINTHMIVSQNLLIIGNTNSPYINIYDTTDWSKQDVEITNLDYCKKFDASCDLSTRHYIETPINQFPKDNHKGFRSFENLESSDFDTYNITDTHSKSQWRIYNSSGDIIFDSGESDNLLSFSLAPSGSTFFDTPAVFMWQVRYKGSSGLWSFWSHRTSFSTVNSYIKKPTNSSPEDGEEDVIVNPTLTSSTFTCINYADTHLYSQWRIYQKNTKNIWTVIYDTHSISIGSLINYTVPSGILSGSTSNNIPEYGWSVRYKGDVLDWSEWSDITSFKTAVVGVSQPTNIIPSNGSVNINETNVTLIASKFAVETGYNDILSNVEFIVKQNSDIIYNSGQIEYTDMTSNIEYILPTDLLEDGEKTYSWSCRYKASVLGWSNWSTETSFTTRVDQTAIVIVNISPSLIDPSTGLSLLQWRWRNSDSTVYSKYIQPSTETYIEPNQTIIIEFNSYYGYNSPSAITVTLAAATTYTYNVTYSRLTGSLTYNITPSIASWRRVGTSTWRASGYTETDIYYGTYSVEFSNVDEYETPTIDQGIVINGDVIKTKTYTASPPYTITVIINMGKWKLVSDGIWRNSGDIINVPYGDQTITFENLDNYTKPDDINFNHKNDFKKYASTSITRRYYFTAAYVKNQNHTIYGWLQVNIVPTTAKWKLSTDTEWHNSNEKVMYNEGLHILEFSKVTNYITPEDLIVTVTADQTTTQNIIYKMGTKDTYNIYIKISPKSVANNTQTKYRVRYENQNWTNWIQYYVDCVNGVYQYNDTEILTNVTPGTYEIEFSEVSGFPKPSNKKFNIGSVISEDIYVTCNYDNSGVTSNGTINLKLECLTPTGESIETPQSILDSIKFKHTVVDNETQIYSIAKDKNNSDWGTWVSYNNFNTISKNLDTTKIHLYQISTISNYFNMFGDVIVMQFNGSSNSLDLIVSLIKYDISTVTFGIAFNRYDDNIVNNIKNASIPITVKCKTGLYTDYYKQFTVTISGDSLTYLEDNNVIPIPYLKSREYTLQELFGSNNLGYIDTYFDESKTYANNYYLRNNYTSPVNILKFGGYCLPAITYFDSNVNISFGPSEAGGTVTVSKITSFGARQFIKTLTTSGLALPGFPYNTEGRYRLDFTVSNSNYNTLSSFEFDYEFLDPAEPDTVDYTFTFPLK